jgi:hypothetical protein
MSRAFTKESEQEWLGDVDPEIAALERFLSREHGDQVSHVRSYEDPGTGTQIHEMSNGNHYSLDMDGRWRQLLHEE